MTGGPVTDSTVTQEQNSGGAEAPRDEKARATIRNDVRNKSMATEDKVVLAILAGFAIGTLWLLRWVLATVFDVAVGASSGVGFGQAFTYAVIASIVLMITFALAAGDGALGELTTMVVGFFLMVGFFTVSIALIL